MESRYKWLVLAIVATHFFQGAMDPGVVLIALPLLTRVFETDAATIVWVSAVYTLTSAVLMLIVGSLADLVGRKRFYLWGFGLFGLGLALAALAPSLPWLIAAQAVKGVGNAMLLAVGRAMLFSSFPPDERGKALGLSAIATPVGVSTGPLFGGLVADLLPWPALFALRIPLSLGSLALSWLILKEDHSTGATLRFDLAGALTLFVGMASLLLTINLASTQGLGAPAVVALGVVALSTLVTFVLVESRALQPVVDLALFRNHQLASAVAANLLHHVAYSAYSFLIPFFLIRVLDYSSSATGLLVSLLSIITIMVSPLSGMAADRLGPRLPSAVGLAVALAGIILIGDLAPEASLPDLASRLFVFTLGAAIFGSPIQSAIMGSVPEARLATASALFATSRHIATSTGATVAGGLFASRELAHEAQLAAQGWEGSPLAKAAMAASFHDVLLLAAGFSLLALLAVLVRFEVHARLAPAGGPP